jgi:predicted ATPase
VATSSSSARSGESTEDEMLDSIDIDNFRSCENVHLRLGEAVVALLGKNGAGKTNVLHAIQLVADLCVGEAESTFSLHPRDSSKPTTLTLKFSIGSSNFEYRTSRSLPFSKIERFEESLNKDNILIFSRTGEETVAPLAGLPQGVRLGTRAATLPTLLQILPEGNPASGELRPVADYLRSVNYYSLLQGFQEHFVGPQRSFAGDQLSDSSPFIEVARYEAWKAELLQGRARRSVQMRLLHLFLTDNSSFGELKTLLGDDGLGLLADIRVEQVRLRGRPATEKADKVDEAFESAYTLLFVPGVGLAGAGRPFRYSGLSAGTWRILQLLTYLVFDKNSCMLLEQPEDSIHPGLLAKVIDILRTYSGRTQLICTTHSPRVMNLVGPKGIRLVTAIDGSTSVESLSDENLKAANGYLRDEGTLAEFLDTL